MPRLASVAKGTRILEAVTGGKKRCDVTCGAPMQKVNRPAVAQPTGRACPAASGASQYLALGAPLVLTGGKNLRVPYKCPKPMPINGVEVAVNKPSMSSEIIEQLIQV